MPLHNQSQDLGPDPRAELDLKLMSQTVAYLEIPDEQVSENLRKSISKDAALVIA